MTDRAGRLGLEPGSINIGWPEDALAREAEIRHSTAISLKRIADLLQGDRDERLSCKQVKKP